MGQGKWKSMTLGEMGHWFGGGTPSKARAEFWTDGDIPWVSPKDMKTPRIQSAKDLITMAAVKGSATSLVPPGSVLVVVRSGILKHTLPVAITEREVTLNQDLKAITPNPDILPEYLAHGLKAFERKILDTCCKDGTTVQNIKMPSFLRFEMPVPPLPEQRRIVARIEELFSRLAAGVAALRHAKAQLQRYRQSVLAAAVTGQLTQAWREQHPDTEPAELLLKRTLKERRESWNGSGKYKEPDPLEDTPSGSIPESWAWASIAQIGFVQLGRQRSPKNRSKDYPTKYIRAANITEDGLALEDLLEMEFSPSEQTRFRLKFGDIILSEASGSPDQVGKPAIWKDEVENCCFQNTVIRLRATGFDNEFLLIVLKHFHRNKVFANIAGGVGINHLSAAKFSKMSTAVPPLAEQHQIVAEVEARTTAIDHLEAELDRQITRSNRLRQSVLASAFRGS
jgi:type I restriction enzyme S subunit